MQRFDPSSGQTFIEEVVKARRKPETSGPRWYYRARGTSILRDLDLHGGPPTLEILTIRALLRNLNSVEDGALRDLPLLLAQRCWDQVKRK